MGRQRKTQDVRATPNARRGATEPQVEGGGELTGEGLGAVECMSYIFPGQTRFEISSRQKSKLGEAKRSIAVGRARRLHGYR